MRRSSFWGNILFPFLGKARIVPALLAVLLVQCGGSFDTLDVNGLFILEHDAGFTGFGATARTHDGERTRVQLIGNGQRSEISSGGRRELYNNFMGPLWLGFASL